ncbi:MAG: PQQ-dependent dehydrogenase, methanol/ethanol family [Gemmatimonadaceae bacterium]
MHSGSNAVVRYLLALCVACTAGDDLSSSGDSVSASSVAPQLPPDPADGEWRMQAKNYQGWRYSGLARIDTATVGNLRESWSFSTGTLRGHEGTPLVAGSTMYIVTPFPNIAYALDLAAPVKPAVKWKFEPNPSPRAVGKACCDVVNRGWALAGDKLIYNLLDAHTVAVDVNTGREVWRTKLDEVENGVTMTMSPLVIRDMVLVGNSGGEMGAHGWLTALDVNTGQVRWRAYATGPDSLVRIDHTYRPFYEWMRTPNSGMTSWPQEEWPRGGGASWGWITYDESLDLLYYGTSNPSPWNQEQRPGDNLFSAAMFARDPDDGMAKWAYQFTPHDEWDYDGVNENTILDLPVGGSGQPVRPVIVHFNRNGFVYVIDRRTGQVLSADRFQPANWADSINLTTGRPHVRPEKRTWENRWTRNICPHALGAKNHPHTAWSPRTGLLYAPTMNLCMDYIAYPVSYIAGTPYFGAETRTHVGQGGHRGELIAWDPVGRRKVWGITETFPVHSPVLATAGDVVFYGTVEGDFKAVHAGTGRLLWSRRLPSGIIGGPMTYLGPDGKQYVAVMSGIGGVMGGFRAVEGFPSAGGTLHVFQLP